jgi:hypothetical protein
MVRTRRWSGALTDTLKRSICLTGPSTPAHAAAATSGDYYRTEHYRIRRSVSRVRFVMRLVSQRDNSIISSMTICPGTVSVLWTCCRGEPFPTSELQALRSCLCGDGPSSVTVDPRKPPGESKPMDAQMTALASRCRESRTGICGSRGYAARTFKHISYRWLMTYVWREPSCPRQWVHRKYLRRPPISWIKGVLLYRRARNSVADPHCFGESGLNQRWCGLFLTGSG